MAKKLTNRTTFALLAGVTQGAVTRACSVGLKKACVGKLIDMTHPVAVEYLEKHADTQSEIDENGTDVLYPQVLKFCKAEKTLNVSVIVKNFGITKYRAQALVGVIRANKVYKPNPHKPGEIKGSQAAKIKRKAATIDELIDIPENITIFMDWTLREIYSKFGTEVRFVDFLNATKKIEDINEKQLKNATTRGDLIARSMVKVGIIDIINAAHLRLMKDGAKTIAAGVISKHTSGAELAESENFVSDILGSFITPVKAKMTRVVKDA